MINSTWTYYSRPLELTMNVNVESNTWSFMIAMREDTLSTMLDPWGLCWSWSKTMGRQALQRLLPNSVGSTPNTSWPLRNGSTTLSCWGFIYHSFTQCASSMTKLFESFILCITLNDSSPSFAGNQHLSCEKHKLAESPGNFIKYGLVSHFFTHIST